MQKHKSDFYNNKIKWKLSKFLINNFFGKFFRKLSPESAPVDTKSMQKESELTNAIVNSGPMQLFVATHEMGIDNHCLTPAKKLLAKSVNLRMSVL